MASHPLLSLHLPKFSPLPLLRASSVVTVQSPSESLEERFGRKGIKFSDSGDVPTVELTVRNGSSLRLRIPDGIVTSYKPKVYWKDDGFEEVLHTICDGASLVKGGQGLVLNDVSRDGPPWSASEWCVKDSDSDSIDAVQVMAAAEYRRGRCGISAEDLTGQVGGKVPGGKEVKAVFGELVEVCWAFFFFLGCRRENREQSLFEEQGRLCSRELDRTRKAEAGWKTARLKLVGNCKAGAGQKLKGRSWTEREGSLLLPSFLPISAVCF